MTGENKKLFGVLLFALLLGPILGTFAAVIRPMMDRLGGERFGQMVGFVFGASILLISIYLLQGYIRSIWRGERSWKIWLPAVLIILFWMVMIFGEFIFPH